jgi:hypothetical protein
MNLIIRDVMPMITQAEQDAVAGPDGPTQVAISGDDPIAIGLAIAVSSPHFAWWWGEPIECETAPRNTFSAVSSDTELAVAAFP